MKTRRKKTVLIFGGCGFIGYHLLENLLPDYKIRVFDKKNFSRKNLQAFGKHIEIEEGDFCNINDYKHILKDVDYVIHLICSTLPSSSNNNCAYDIESNVISTLRFLNYFKKSSKGKIIFFSSGGTIYGNAKHFPIKEQYQNNPLCSYGITKLMIEKYLYLYRHLYGIDYYVVRLSNPFGERQNWNNNQGVITTFLHKIVTGQPIEIWGQGNIIRDYIYIGDAVACISELLKYHGPHRVFNVSSGKGYSINQILKKIKKITQKEHRVIYKGQRIFDIKKNILDNTLVKNELKWHPETTLEEGIKKTYNWIKSVEKAKEKL